MVVRGWQDRLKAYRREGLLTNIAVSHAISKALSVPSNDYSQLISREPLFMKYPIIPRFRDLVFLGRLVSDKGVSLILDSLVQLKSIGLTPSLTIIGQGPEQETLRQQAKANGVADQVEFVGSQVGLKTKRNC